MVKIQKMMQVFLYKVSSINPTAQQIYIGSINLYQKVFYFLLGCVQHCKQGKGTVNKTFLQQVNKI